MCRPQYNTACCARWGSERGARYDINVSSPGSARNRFAGVLALLLVAPALAADHGTPTAAAQAARAGVRSCLRAIESMESWLTRGQTGNALAFWDGAASDRNLFSALIALENPSGNSLADLNVVPSSDGQCVVEYTQTGYVARSCAEYLASLGPAARFVRDLNGKTALVQGQGVQIYLSPAGQGCLWMRKQIVKQPAATSPSEPAAAGPQKRQASTTNPSGSQ
ncbi:MAG TPA: hypothetical protein VGD18_04310 [Thiobacillaceae bacterium]